MTITTPFSTIPNDIVARLNTQITLGGDGGAAILTVWANAAYTEPQSGRWISAVIREGSRTLVQFGSPRSRTLGILFVECRDDWEHGTKNLTDLAERVRAAFDRWQSSNGVQFRAPYLQGGSSGDRVGGWWRLTVACPFYADDVS